MFKEKMSKVWKVIKTVFIYIAKVFMIGWCVVELARKIKAFEKWLKGDKPEADLT